MTATAVASVLLGAVALLESIGLRPIESNLDRPGALAGNATDQGILGAIYLAVLGSLLLGAWLRTGALAWWAVAGTAAALVSVATSASRAAALAAGVAVIALSVRFVVLSRRRRQAALIAAAAIVLLVVLVLAIPASRERLLGLDALARQTVDDRYIMWTQAWEVFQASPLLGVGPSGFADAVTSRFADDWYLRASTELVLDSPHNVLLQVLVAGGVAGASHRGIGMCRRRRLRSSQPPLSQRHETRHPRGRSHRPRSRWSRASHDGVVAEDPRPFGAAGRVPGRATPSARGATVVDAHRSRPRRGVARRLHRMDRGRLRRC